MKLFGIDLPEPILENTSKAISIARRLHQDAVDRKIRNTKKVKWDKYWVAIYDLVLNQLRDEGK